MKYSRILLSTPFLILTLAIFYFAIYHPVNPENTPPPPVLSASVAGSLQPQLKTTGCQVNGAVPDPGCTPGATFPEVTRDQVCTAGYTKTVRNVSEETKRQVYREYGIVSRQPGEFEVDHLISLELGGSNEIANLWPEAAAPPPGFHEKDLVENYLNHQVCQGKLTLREAQKEIATNWLQVFQNTPGIEKFRY